ncbi:MAG TPA: hypothetical protein DD412_07595 [Holosporales bacterium]|nr:hypothetical protein [Holosporales bacterium]
MPQKNTNPQKNAPQEEENKAATPTKKSKNTSPSPRKAVNLFMVVLLLIIVGGIYLHQKGYVTKYFPIVKTKFSGQSPIDATVDIPQGTSMNFPETLTGNSNATADETETTAAPPQGIPSTSSDSYGSSMNVGAKTSSDSMESEAFTKLQERVAALEKKLLTLSTSTRQTQNETPSTGGATVDNTLIVTLSNLQDLQNRLDQGLPFTQELLNLKNLLDAEDYAVLKEYAPFGVPNLPYLIKNFKGVERLLKQQEAFKNSTTFLEKSSAFLGQLIHIEKVTTSDQDTHDLTGISSYKMRLRNGDIENIITEIEGLTNKDETLTLWLSHAKAYNVAQKIIRKTKQSLFQPNL